MILDAAGLDPAGTVLSGQLLLSAPIAVAAGLVSFLSPCILPLVPGYLGFIGGIAGASESRRRLVAGVGLFVAGFTLVFVLSNAIVGAASMFLIQWGGLIMRIMGVLLILLGLVFVGRFPFMQRIAKPTQTKRTGLVAAPLVGIVFALGWTPCSGPTLAAIGALTVTSGSAWQGALLGLLYSLGLGIPFVAIAFGFGWATTSIAWVRKHIRAINITGGVLLIAVGALMASGVWEIVMNQLQGWIGSVVTVI